MRRAQIISVALGVALTSCTPRFLKSYSPSIRRVPTELFTPADLTPPLSQAFAVAAGERILVRGALFDSPALLLRDTLTVPFEHHATLTIKPGLMRLAYQQGDFNYYAAADGQWGYDGWWQPNTVGVRVDGDLSEFSAFSDCTDYVLAQPGTYPPRIYEITSALTGDQVALLSQSTVRVADYSGRWAALYYAGFNNGKVHFELEDTSEPDPQRRRMFSFDVPSSGETTIAIKRFVLKVLAVDNTRLAFEWVSVGEESGVRPESSSEG